MTVKHLHWTLRSEIHTVCHSKDFTFELINKPPDNDSFKCLLMPLRKLTNRYSDGDDRSHGFL